MAILARATAALSIAIFIGACAEADPAKYRLNVIFPSTAMAIATEDVRFIVYDDPKPGACERIYLKRITNQSDLPPVVTQTPLIPVCELAFGKPPTIELSTGKHYSVLAVASRGTDDFLVGCSDVAISSDDGDITVYVGLPSATPLPPTDSCTSFEDSCFNRCP